LYVAVWLVATQYQRHWSMPRLATAQQLCRKQRAYCAESINHVTMV